MCLHNSAAPVRALVVLKGVGSWLQRASLFHGTERNGTDQFRVLFDGTEQRWNGKISALVCACTFMQEQQYGQGFRSVCYSLDYIRGC